MSDYNITVNVNVNINGKDSGGGGSADSVTIPATILYLLGFIGMGIMLFNIPTYLIVVGILGLLLYMIPLFMVIFAVIVKAFSSKHDYRLRDYEFTDEEGRRIKVVATKTEDDTKFFRKDREPFTVYLCELLYSGGSVFKNILKNFIAPFAFCLFNVFLAIFWICYPLGSIQEGALIAILIPSAYSMYYFPYILIKAARRYHSKLLGFTTAGIIIASLALFLINYDNFMATNAVVGIAFFFTMITVLGTLAILITNLVLSKPRIKQFAITATYLVLAVVVGALSIFVLPKQKEEKYSNAIACVESGDYRQARELFSALGRYKDSQDRYAEIKYIGLQVGERLIMGSQYDKPGATQSDNPLSWTVISVSETKALLLSDAILTSIESNPLNEWNANNSVKNELVKLEYLFPEEEKSRILNHSYSITINGENLQVTDKLFLLSQAELQQYCTTEQIFSKKDTKYNDHQVLSYMMQNSEYEYVYSYYIRNADNSGEWIIADCQSKQFVVKSNRYVGIRPAMYISFDEAK